MFLERFILMAAITGTALGSGFEDLMDAIEEVDVEKVKVVLKTVPVDVEGFAGWNALHRAALFSNGEITRVLVSHGAHRIVNDRLHMPSEPDDAITPLMVLCFRKRNAGLPVQYYYEIMEALLMAGGDPNERTIAEKNSVLHLAVTGPEARLLIRYGAIINGRNIHGCTPAFTCLMKKRYEVLHALADCDADFTVVNNKGDTIFHVISNEYKTNIWTREVVRLLARKGVPLEAFNHQGETPLTLHLKTYYLEGGPDLKYPSIRYKNLNDSFFAYMAEVGADLKAPNQHGDTLLHLAVCKYDPGLAKWLIEHRADAEAQNANGDSPLLALVKEEKRKFVDGRVKKKYSISPTRKEEIRIVDVINVLLGGGARLDAVDGDGHDALYYLRETGLSLVYSYIEYSLKNTDSLKSTVEEKSECIGSTLSRRVKGRDKIRS